MGNDTHYIICFVSNPMTGGLRSANTCAKDPPSAGITVTLLDPMVATVSVASTGPLQFDASLGAVTGAYLYGLSIGQNTTARRLFVDLSPAWLGTGATLAYTTPDVTSLAGWDPSWELSVGEVTDWFVGASVSTGPADFDDDITPGPDPSMEGVVTRSTTQGGQVTP